MEEDRKRYKVQTRPHNANVRPKGLEGRLVKKRDEELLDMANKKNPRDSRNSCKQSGRYNEMTFW
jgi:hypothetical protein